MFSLLLSSSFDFLFILLFCLLGAITKDTYETMVGKNYKVKVGRILVSTIVSSIIIFSFSDYLMQHFTWKMIILPCFCGGMVGFQLLGKMTKLSFWSKFLKNHKEDILKELVDDNNDDNSKGT